MNNFPIRGNPRLRRGIALGLVLIVGVAVLVLGMAMITTSGGQLSSSVDSKQKIRSRIAAETQATLQMAAAVDKSSLLFGSDMSLPGNSMTALPTGDGTKGSTTVTQIGLSGGVIPQEKISFGDFKGMMGYKLDYTIHSTGWAPGGAQSQVDAEIKIYQVPVFQFGVFYQGNLEICPGSQMNVGGPVHTNGSAYFRSPGNPSTDSLTFQGPVTVTGSIYQWKPSPGGPITYRIAPDSIRQASFYKPALLTTLTLMDTTSSPTAVGGTSNVQWGADSLTFPIGGASPRSLLLPKSASDPAGLTKQKFDNRTTAAARWVNGTTAQPAWILAPRVFFDRREQAWVKYWDFDITKIPAAMKDSIFYLADTLSMTADRGTLHKQVINAIRIVNAAMLPRNMTIATPNPVYLVGDFNTPNAASTCHPAGVGAPLLPDKYCNAMIASDAFTLLSTNWTGYAASATFDQPYSNATWTTGANPEPAFGTPGSYNGTITVNAAIMTGNKPAYSWAYPPLNAALNNNTFEGGYEGGWPNTIRFLENLYPGGAAPFGQATVNFNGSFVCLFAAAAPGLNQGDNITRVLQTLAFPGPTSGYYSAPKRVWKYDTRFVDLANMPPATPFLTTAPSTSWSELR